MLFRDGSALNHDLDAYLEIAHHLVQGEGFSLGNPLHPTAYRPPLYPLLIAGLFKLGGGIWVLGGFQVVLGVLTTALTLRCGRLLNLGWGQFIAGVFVAFDPLLIRYTTLPMTETLCAALVMLWCWVMLEFPVQRSQSGWTDAVEFATRTGIRGSIHGVCFGLICLCRPAFLAAAGLATLWIIATQMIHWWKRKTSHTTSTPENSKRLRSVIGPQLACLTGLVIVLAPWVVRNSLVIGKPTPATTHGGYTILLANNPVFYNEVLDAQWGAVWEENSLLKWQQELEQDLQRDGIPVSDEVARDAWMYHQARSNIRAQPLTFVRACLYRCVCFWSLAPSSKANRLGATASWFITLFYGLISVGALLGLVRLTKLEWSRWSPLLLLPLTLWITHLVYWTDTRMRAPVTPILALLAARGITKFHPRNKSSTDL
jgi:hypothetical protein